MRFPAANLTARCTFPVVVIAARPVFSWCERCGIWGAWVAGRLCAVAACGQVFEPFRSDSRYCSQRCSKRADRGAPVLPLEACVPRGSDDPAHPRLPVNVVGDGVLAATIVELEAVNRVFSAKGQAAQALAAQIDTSFGTAQGLAALVREWRATLDDAKAGAGSGSALDRVLDEVRARRDQRQGA